MYTSGLWGYNESRTLPACFKYVLPLLSGLSSSAACRLRAKTVLNMQAVFKTRVIDLESSEFVQREEVPGVQPYYVIGNRGAKLLEKPIKKLLIDSLLLSWGDIFNKIFNC